MNVIIAKFRHVIRYGVAVLLPAVPCFSSYAGCTAQYDPDAGGWWVDCDLSDSFFVPGSGGGEEGSGSCTNCTAMSPASCENMKNSLLSFLDSLTVDTSSIDWNFSEALSLCSDAKDLIDEAKSYPDLPDDVFIPIDLAWESVSFIEDELYYIQSELEDLRPDVSTLQSYVNGIDCSPCQSSGGGTSGGGSGTGTTPSGCPCSEFINAVNIAVNNCKLKLDDIDSKIDSIKSRLNSWDEILKQIKNDVYSIRQTTDRMDDFFRDDTDYNFKKLIEHVLVLSNAVFASPVVALPPNLYWQDYTNATQFSDDSGSYFNWRQKGERILSGSEGYQIDFGEYTSLNWFQRIEFLLGHLSGIFTKTNSPSSDFTSSQKREIDQVEGGFVGLDGSSEKTVIESMISAVEGSASSLNPFYGLFSGHNSHKITLLPDVSVDNVLLPDSKFPSVELDLEFTGDGSLSINSLVELCHNITTFLAFVLFLLLDVFGIYKFVVCLIMIHRWYWRVYNSWVATMFNGAGR